MFQAQENHFCIPSSRGTSEAKRLELQWSKLCEEEKKSQKRNQKLLEDFERVEHHAGVLAAKTQKLKAAKVL